MNPNLFVYGSLMSSSHHPMGDRLRREARLLGDATIEGSLYRISWYPGLVAGGQSGERVHGEVYALATPARALACECERDPATNLTQALQLVSGPMVSTKLRDNTSRAATLAASALAADQIIEELFLTTLSRLPTTPERDVLARRLAAAPNRRTAIEDALWTLLNHREFLFQH